MFIFSIHPDSVSKSGDEKQILPLEKTDSSSIEVVL